MATRFTVDWIRCDGYGLCGDLLPELIELDDWRYPIILADAVPPDLEHAAQRAVDCCPVRAIRLERLSERRRGREPMAS